MRLISWNVNGLRACMQKGFLDTFRQLDADFFCLQETKLQPGQLSLELPGYLQFWNSAQKKGYSGTAIFARKPPLDVQLGIGQAELDTEGRLIILEYPGFYLATCYTPNAQEGLKRIDFRLAWDKAFREKLSALAGHKPVVVCGDLNVAHQEIDRFLYPERTGAYSWWSYRFNARKNNAGWRIDYFLVSNVLQSKIRQAEIYADIFGSDHCPVGLELEV